MCRARVKDTVLVCVLSPPKCPLCITISFWGLGDGHSLLSSVLLNEQEREEKESVEMKSGMGEDEGLGERRETKGDEVNPRFKQAVGKG